MRTSILKRVPAERIAQAIVLVRGQRVMLDRDLATLYGVETRVLNQAVRRNMARFPTDFMVVLTREEIRDISQIVTCSTIKHARSVSAFTEQGVAMLSSILKSEHAIAVKHRHHAGVRPAARDAVRPQGIGRETGRSGAQDRWAR
ncbi:MAG: ORF6N domain-containing protein [Kofleriaceae bacterium]|nr:ORF6N domain-containing protein [Candidatus Methylomirabilis lanthanidiphila]